MKHLMIYLGGPITGISYDSTIGWREKLIKELPEFSVLSPMRSKTYLSHEKEIKANYEDSVLSCQRGIQTKDYNDVKRSDLLIINFLGATKVSIGTVMEVAWARAFDIPVILIIEPTGNIHDHPMIRECTGFRIDNIDDAVNLAKVILLP
jgi:nucleoside 2-deoxyribosyltransferase